MSVPKKAAETVAVKVERGRGCVCVQQHERGELTMATN